jgi:hypothetical protein
VLALQYINNVGTAPPELLADIKDKLKRGACDPSAESAAADGQQATTGSRRTR